MPRYDPARIEPKWQQYWDDHQTFRVASEPDPRATGKLYVLDMFPYPSGEGLHVGHPEGYTATDIVVRHARMNGRQVLHPMGWDAFGLPAEQHAINTGTHPRVTTYKNIDTFRRQLKMLGFSYDWSREISTTDEEYVRWTQWIFLQLYNSWFDADHEWTGPDGRVRRGKGRPIDELPVPTAVRSAGIEAVRRYQDARRLAYQSEAPVNWCPALGTVLANEEVTADGRSDRGNHPVERRALRQWMLRITDYAQRLMDELEDVQWPESVKALQRNWIGRSEGAEVDFYTGPLSFAEWQSQRRQEPFPAAIPADTIRVYTTRPDTLFGATYMVLAPEHPLVESLTTPAQRAAVDAYRQKSALKTDLDRTDLAKDKSGVFTGSLAVNPLTGSAIPVWIADYVLMTYGTGAIMAVPAHDLRDFEFAARYDLPIVPVVAPPAGYEPSRDERALAIVRAESTITPFAGLGTVINSGPFNGLTTAECKTRVAAELASAGLGKQAVNYRLRDWLFSRQRYWGEPFPLWHELDAAGNPTGLMRPVAAEELPVTLPDMEDFKPKGTPEPPLSWAPEAWLYKTDSDGVRLKRETNSMPQWAGSCWYYLRFCDPRNATAFLDPTLEKYWLPVDLYVGGAEHAVLHLLYARFWHKVLFDLGHVSCAEPFRRLVNQGMILGEPELTGYRLAPSDSHGEPGDWISARQVKDDVDTLSGQPAIAVTLASDDVEKSAGELTLKGQPGIIVESRAAKMSKSRGNVINPDDIVKDYGADALRMYEMFMGPLEQMKPWSMSGVEGVSRFLSRVWRLFVDDKSETVALHPAVQDVPPSPEQLRVLHKTIKAVSDDITKLSFNTAISRMMEFVNEISGQEPRPVCILEPFVLLLSPFAPHVAEECWELLGHPESLAYAPWPQFDPALLVESEVEIAVQVNGKVRGKIRIPADADEAAVQAVALAEPNVASHTAGKTIVNVRYIAGRMLSLSVK